jgi:hypothetical protein
MKLKPHELQLLATAFLVLEEDMTYEQEEEIFRRSQCSVGDLSELADKCKLVAATSTENESS